MWFFYTGSVLMEEPEETATTILIFYLKHGGSRLPLNTSAYPMKYTGSHQKIVTLIFTTMRTPNLKQKLCYYLKENIGHQPGNKKRGSKPRSHSV
jgi:hypothetical protein